MPVEYRPWSNERLHEVLTAVGNHEGKALVFLAMRPGVPYGTMDLHRLLVGLQGAQVVFEGTYNLPQKYCTHTYEPVGLAIRGVSESGFMRHIRNDPDRRASALAAYVLCVLEDLTVGLIQVFGRTSSGRMDAAPGRRLTVLRALLEHEHPLSQAELCRRAGLPAQAASTVVRPLAAAGLVDYSSHTTYLMKTTYLITGPVSASREALARAGLSSAVVDVVNRRWVLGGCREVRVARDEIEDELIADTRWAGRYVRDTLQRVMLRLCEQPSLSVVEGYAQQGEHSSAVLRPEHRGRVGRLVTGIDAIAGGSRTALLQALDEGDELLSQPDRVRALVARCFGANKTLTNPVTTGEKHRLVLQALAEHDGATSDELLARLSALNRPLLGQALNELVKQGVVRSEKQSRGPHKRWYHVPPIPTA